MVNTQAGNTTMSSSLPSIEGGKGSRPKTSQALPDPSDRLFGSMEYLPQDTDDVIQNEFSVRHENTIQIKGIEDHGTIYFRAETNSGKDLNEVSVNVNVSADTVVKEEDKDGPWMTFKPVGAAVGAAGSFMGMVENAAPGLVKESVEAAGELISIATGIGQEKPQPQSPDAEKKKTEDLKKAQEIAFNIQHNNLVQEGQNRASQEEEVKEEARMETLGQSNEELAKESGFNAGYRLVRTVANRFAIFAKRIFKAATAKAQAWNNFQAAGARMGKMGGSSRLDQMAEGGSLSNTGGGGVG